MPEKQICEKCGKPIIEIVKEGVGVWFHQIEFGDCDLTPESQIPCKHCNKPKGEHYGFKHWCYRNYDKMVFEPSLKSAPIKIKR